MLTIAIDGPSGAGKSTLARNLAGKLGILYLDTGAMYRAVAYYMLKNNVDIRNETAVDAWLPRVDIHVRLVDGVQDTYIDGVSVSSFIRTPQVTMAASLVSKYGSVRRTLVDIQRKLAQDQPIVMDGRDIGTHVLKNASYKFFITASPQERARRRYLELIEKGEAISYDCVLADVVARDEQDSTRKIHPLHPAQDAIILYTDNLNAQEVLDAVLQRIQ